MPIAGVGRVEPMDPDVKREVVRRARESGTFATDADATWVGSPLPASVNRRVVSRDATKRPGPGPNASSSSSSASHFGATVAPRTLDYDGAGGRGSFSGAAVHPASLGEEERADGGVGDPSPDRVRAFRASPTPEEERGFGAGRLPWGSVDLTAPVTAADAFTFRDDDDDDDDDAPKSPGGGPLTLRRARELQAEKERATASALGGAHRPVSREGGGASGFHPDSFAGSRPQSREWSGVASGARGPARRRVTAAEISGAMRARGGPSRGSDAAATPGADSSPGAEFPPRPERLGGKPESAGTDSSTEFERETDALLSRAAALMEEEEGLMEEEEEDFMEEEEGLMEEEEGLMEEEEEVSDAKGTAEGGPRGRTPMDADGRRESSRDEPPPPPPPAAAAAADNSPPSAASSSSHHSGDENLPPPPASLAGTRGKTPLESVPVRALDRAVGGEDGAGARLERPPPKRGWVDEVDEVDKVDEVDEVEVDKVEDEDEGGTPDDVFLTAAVASVAPPSVAATSTPSEEAETSTSPTTATVASAGARPGSAASRSNFVSKLPAPPPLSARNPKDGPQKPKGGTRANQNSRLASTFGRDAPAGPAARGPGTARAGARVRSTTSAGYRAPEPRATGGSVNPGLPSAEGGTNAKGGTKKATYRDRIASGRRAATATAATTTTTTEQPVAAPLGTPRHPSSEPDAADGPVPSETPAKLRRREGGEAPLEHERVLTKAEEAKNRLRRNRRSSQSAVGAAGGFTARASDGGGGAGSAGSAVSASVPSHPTSESARPAQKVGLSAAELADRLGSVKRVIKPRSSMPDLGRSRRAETTDGGPDKVDADAAASDTNTAASTLEGGVPVVRGLDEAELVLRVDTLANEDALNATRSAVTRMTELLEYVDATSRRLGCEPQNVFGHLLFRCGAPTDPTSRQLRLNDAVDPTRLQRMVAVTAELRSLLRIKVQDNNDLQLAATALRETAGFFARLDAAAAACSKEPWMILAAQRPGGARARGGRG